MAMSRETRAGWLTSIVVHGILLFVFLLVSIPEIVQKQDFIEVIWGAPSLAAEREPAPAASEPSASPPPSTVISKKQPASKKQSQPVILPERRMTDLSEETFREQRGEKLETPMQGASKPAPLQGGIGEREGAAGQQAGERDRPDPSTVPGSSAGKAPGTGSLGEGVAKGVAFSIQWTQGGSRRKISGDLPKYPEGVNVQAQIKILAVVLPDGSVQSAQPAQKGNTRLEEVAMKEVRFWKFEPLRTSQPQLEQSCIVTFLFTLQ